MSSFLKRWESGVLLSVRVQPRSSNDEICGRLGDALKIRLRAPPVDSAANEALVEFLAEKLQIPRRNVQLIRGQTSRQKQLVIAGVPLDEVEKRLLE